MPEFNIVLNLYLSFRFDDYSSSDSDSYDSDYSNRKRRRKDGSKKVTYPHFNDSLSFWMMIILKYVFMATG